MKEVCILDIETERFEAVDEKPINFLFAVFLFENEEYKITKSLDKFYNVLLSLCRRNSGSGKNYVVYCHNLMFDFTYCLLPLLSCGFQIKFIENGGKLISVKIGKERMKTRKSKDGTTREVKEFETHLEFRDSFSLFQVSLKKLGSFVGLEKIDHDKNFSEEPSAKDLDYCKRDCEIVLKALQKFRDFYSELMNDEYELSELPPTTASASFALFKKFNAETRKYIDYHGKQKEKNVWILTNEDLNEEFLENYYFGGRVELFESTLVENVSYYDINSLYPTVMINNSFHRPPYYWNSDIKKYDLDICVGAICEIDESNQYIPLIPLRHNYGLYFPACAKTTFLFKEEIEYLKNRVPLKLIKLLIGTRGPEKPFEYLRQFYEKKQKKDSMSYFYKILLNATYGRFGIDSNKENCAILPYSDELLTEFGSELIEYVNPETNRVENCIKRYTETNVPFERNLVIATKVTALARLELTKWIHTLIRNKIRIYYCDTDSIVCQDNSILPLGNELGQFKKEHECTWFAGISAKDYILRDKITSEYVIKLKGVHNPEIEEFLQYHEDGVEQVNVSKIRTMIRNGWLDTPRNLVLIKQSKTIYHKRILCNGGSAPIKSFEILPNVEKHNTKYIEKTLQMIKRRMVEETNEENSN